MKKIQKVLEEQNVIHQIRAAKAEETRARSISVGYAFGGTTEISMRSQDSTHLWVLMRPAEVIELINQLAANIGCHIHIQPRKDFASWRQWNDDAMQNQRLSFSNQQPKLKIERNQNEPVAIKKTVNRRSTKRAATTA